MIVKAKEVMLRDTIIARNGSVPLTVSYLEDPCDGKDMVMFRSEDGHKIWAKPNDNVIREN